MKATISLDDYNHILSHDEQRQAAKLAALGLDPKSARAHIDSARGQVVLDDGKAEPEPKAPDEPKREPAQ